MPAAPIPSVSAGSVPSGPPSSGSAGFALARDVRLGRGRGACRLGLRLGDPPRLLSRPLLGGRWRARRGFLRSLLGGGGASSAITALVFAPEGGLPWRTAGPSWRQKVLPTAAAIFFGLAPANESSPSTDAVGAVAHGQRRLLLAELAADERRDVQLLGDGDQPLVAVERHTEAAGRALELLGADDLKSVRLQRGRDLGAHDALAGAAQREHADVRLAGSRRIDVEVESIEEDTAK